MATKVFAGISGFLFIALAAMFGHAFSPDISSDVATFGSVCMFVGAAAFVQGIVFGRQGLISGITCGCLALVMMSLPLALFYGTTEAVFKYFKIMVVVFTLMSLANFLGTLVRQRWTN